ncbi:hypothetical protein [Ktedonobacter racemifer]|uniref:hypothetical protein n=1 Tax=Ktedonobacter racemifer TaxID=363277 RepID=UPI001FCBE16A|nr:hypothetical protein [Ktedonobacter racemifer]
MSIRKVASRLGTSRGTIQRLVEQEGIERQPNDHALRGADSERARQHLPRPLAVCSGY